MGFETIKIDNAKGTQSLQIPESLKINDDKVYIKKVGNVLFVIPFHQPWESLIAGASLFSPDFMEDRNQPISTERESLE